MDEHTGNTSLFAIFALSIYTLFLVCYSLYQCYSWSESANDAAWSNNKVKESTFSVIRRRIFCKANLSTFLLWGLWFLLFWYVSSSSKDLKPFDPYDILGLERTATASEVKKAYRKMSLLFHPDKNPDPEATKYFAEYITKAYKALTDDVARENWDKYGHPDGPQAMTMSVALPEWLFNKDHNMAPVMLLVLVGCGILLPLSVVSWYMLSSDQYEGPNRIMKGTYFNYMFDPKSCIKESMGIGRIPDTLVTAAEFIQMPTFAAQEPLVDDVWKAIMHAHPEYKDKKNNFWKRKGSVLKSHLLLLAYLERQVGDIPQPLRQDLNFVLQKTPLLLEEMVRISVVPKAPYGYGWLAPTMAALEMMQSLIQAVPVRERKAQGKDNPATLLQLPHMDTATARALRSKEKVKGLQELMTRTSKERRTLMQVVGMEGPQAEEVDAFLGALPMVQLQVECAVDGDSAIYEHDIVNCTVKVLLARPNHADLAALPTGKTRPAVTSTYPLPYEESWAFLLADPAGNWVLACREKVQLIAAETAAFEQRKKSKAVVVKDAKNGDAKPSDALVMAAEPADFETAQVVDLTFRAPKAGKYDLALMVVSDCYIGCDVNHKISLRVLPQSRAMAEGRAARQSGAGGDESAIAAAAAKEKEKAKEKAKESEAEEDEEVDSDEDEEEEEDEYDSEESGEEETDDES